MVYRIQGVDDLSLHHLYRAMAFLGEEVEDQKDRTFSPRTTKDIVEEELFHRRLDLFTPLDIVFFDTTSLYFEGQGGDIGELGHSKDNRPDLNQMIVGVMLDKEGSPVCSEMWPGSTTDVTTLIPVIERVRSRFTIGQLCIVADRGMISATTLIYLEKENIPYILGARMRKVKEIRRPCPLSGRPLPGGLSGKRLLQGSFPLEGEGSLRGRPTSYRLPQ